MPKNERGYLFCVITLLFSAVLNAIIFGDIAGLVYALSIDETTVQNINDRNNEVMNDLYLPDDIKVQIREFF